MTAAGDTPAASSRGRPAARRARSAGRTHDRGCGTTRTTACPTRTATDRRTTRARAARPPTAAARRAAAARPDAGSHPSSRRRRCRSPPVPARETRSRTRRSRARRRRSRTPRGAAGGKGRAARWCRRRRETGTRGELSCCRSEIGRRTKRRVERNKRKRPAREAPAMRSCNTGQIAGAALNAVPSVGSRYSGVVFGFDVKSNSARRSPAVASNEPPPMR